MIKPALINKSSLGRIFMFVFSGILFLALFSGTLTGKITAATAGFMLFLGITNFGRQCPLSLSVQYYISRIKKKKSSQINREKYHDKRSSSQTN